MRKYELEKIIAGFDAATEIGLTRIRGHGVCRSCGAGLGSQHEETCAMWPLILARAELRAAEEEA